MERNRRVSYKEGAEVRAPVKPEDLPAQASEPLPRGGAEGGPGLQRQNVTPARPRDAGVEGAQEEA